MRILLLSHAPDDMYAGASRVYHLLREGLSASGHAVRMWHREDFRPLRFRPAQKVIDRLALPRFMARRARAEAASGYDVVMVPSGMGYALFRAMRSYRTRPLLVNHSHGLWLFDHQAKIAEHLAGHAPLPLLYRSIVAVTGPIKGAWDARASRYADLTIVQNDRDYDFLMRSGLALDRLVRIAPGIHPEILAASTAVTPSSARPASSLLWFGDWSTRKGADAVPAAFDLILGQVPEATLTIGGANRPEAEIRARFSTLGVQRVRVIRKITAIADQVTEFNRHAIFLFPSLSEGYGLAVVEAMALGLAAVTTLTGVGGDALCHRDTAMIVPPASALHLARAVVALIREDALRHGIAIRGQELVRMFTAKRMVADYERAFMDALRRQGAGPQQVTRIRAA
jgi:glycosyltransferase involved in cell wall biosynthesis